MKLRPLPYQEESNHIVLKCYLCVKAKETIPLVHSLLPRFHLHSLPSQPRPQALGVCHFQYEFHTASDEHTKPWKEGTLFPLYSFPTPPSSLSPILFSLCPSLMFYSFSSPRLQGGTVCSTPFHPLLLHSTKTFSTS